MLKRVLKPGQQVTIRCGPCNRAVDASLLALTDHEKAVLKLAAITPGTWLKPGTKVQVEVSKKSDATYASQAVIHKLFRSKLICVLSDLEEFKRIQRRNFARLAVNLEAQYAILPQRKFSKGQVVDISGGGVLLVTQSPLPSGCRLELNMEIELDSKKLPLALKGKVVRELPPSSEYSTRFKYGIKFEELPLPLQDKIIGFIFQEMAKKTRVI